VKPAANFPEWATLWRRKGQKQW